MGLLCVGWWCVRLWSPGPWCVGLCCMGLQCSGPRYVGLWCVVLCSVGPLYARLCCVGALQHIVHMFLLVDPRPHPRNLPPRSLNSEAQRLCLPPVAFTFLLCMVLFALNFGAVRLIF